jgi:hypothetical protein
MKRHKTFFVYTLEEINFCGKQILGLKGSEFELPFQTIPTKGAHDYTTCEGCQNSLKNIYENTKIKVIKFPFCCALHANLAKEKWFNKNDFENIPSQVSEKIIFTNQHIINNISKDEWFNEITNYIDYTIQSFGSMPIGYGEPVCLGDYFNYVINFLNQKDSTTIHRRNKILEYLASLRNPGIVETDFNIILSTYQKWLKIFPFEIGYFKNLKHQFENNLPILSGKPVFNPYLGLTKAKLTTQSELIESLSNTTKSLLNSINTKDLVEKGMIADNAKYTIELLNEGHRIKQQSLLGEYVKGENKYINILKTWLKNEKEYFKELTFWINTTSRKHEADIEQTRAEKLKASIKLYNFFELGLIKNLTTEKQNELIEIIAKNNLPYQIAMFDYLGFIEHLHTKYFPTKYKLHKEISKWLNSDKDGRAVKANISSLLKNSTENKSRYTAYKHIQTVEKDYQKLK